MIPENLQIISDMITMASADKVISDQEYEFILLVADKLNVEKFKVDKLIEEPINAVIFKTELERITQFHRVLLVMNVDAEVHLAEIDALRNYGLKLGIRPEAIEQILVEMRKYDNNMIPAERLIGIFKQFYN